MRFTFQPFLRYAQAFSISTGLTSTKRSAEDPHNSSATAMAMDERGPATSFCVAGRGIQRLWNKFRDVLPGTIHTSSKFRFARSRQMINPKALARSLRARHRCVHLPVLQLGTICNTLASERTQPIHATHEEAKTEFKEVKERRRFGNRWKRALGARTGKPPSSEHETNTLFP